MITLEELIIALVRISGSLPVLRWAFVGAALAILFDLSDLFLKNLIDLGGVSNYQTFDKWLDLVYMSAFLVVAMRWNGIIRQVAVFLFILRMIGFVTFELTQNREVLQYFPNVFEFWFLAVTGLKHFNPSFIFSNKTIGILLLIVFPLKLFQEYVLHNGQWLDGFTAVEAVERMAHWLTSVF
jgi:hypothetical protein